MDAERACELINSLTVKPGYRLTATPVGASMVKLIIHCTTFDTSEPPFFPRQVTTGKVCRFPVREVRSDTELVAHIIHQMVRFELHEWREFVCVRRPDGKYTAPFHPHTDEGVANYEDTEVFW